MDHNSERVFLAIEAVAQASEPLSLEQIASAACLSRATVYRLVAALCNSGILLREMFSSAEVSSRSRPEPRSRMMRRW